MIDFVLMDEFRYFFDVGINIWLLYCCEMLVEEGCVKVFVYVEMFWNGVIFMINGFIFKMLKFINSFKMVEKLL